MGKSGRAIPSWVCDESSCQEGDVSWDFAGKGFGQDAGLQFQSTAVADFVVEDRMDDKGVHPLFVDLEEAFAGREGEVDGAAGLDEVFGGQDAFVDQGEDHAVGDDGPEFFHQIERQGRASKTRLMEEADVGIKSDRQKGQHAVFGQEAVG